MNVTRAATVVGVMAVAGVLITCQNDPVRPPTPGWVNLRLVSPRTDDGGIVFSIGGAPLDSVRSSFLNMFMTRQSDSALRVVIVGDIGSGVIGQILVPDTRQAASYAAVVSEVAARGTFLQREATGYTIKVEPAP